MDAALSSEDCSGPQPVRIESVTDMETERCRSVVFKLLRVDSGSRVL